MEKENGRFDAMESKLHHTSLRQKSKVPRTRLPQRYEYVDGAVNEYRNGAVKKTHSPREYEPAGMNTAPLHLLADTDENKEWQRLLGQRVCISGVKPGILRYYGRTNFAQGYWCGVELDEPVGKHNGIVNGVVYFNCKPNHGIFAPVGKVSKLNDLSACSWQADSVPFRTQDVQHRHSSWDYNMGLLPNSQEVRFIKNSTSDPTSLKPRIQANVPHGSQSFSYDPRNIIEKRRSESISVKAIRQFENSDLSSRHSKSFNGNSAFNITNNSSSHSLSKYGCDKNNQFFSSNVMRRNDDFGSSEHVQDLCLNRDMPKISAEKTDVQIPSMAMAMEEFEQFIQTPTNSGQVSPLTSEIKRFKERTYFDCNKITDCFFNSIPSYDYPELEEEMNNDDQMSIDYDESLGILTPSQMKDFTLCPDFPTSSSDIKGLDFPSSESFDDINELPEDEQVNDVFVQYVSETSASRNIEITKPKNLEKYSNNFMVLNEDNKVKKILSTTDKFLSSISQKNIEKHNIDSSSILNNIAVTNMYSSPTCNVEKESSDKNSESNPISKTIDLVKNCNIDSINTFTPPTTFNQYYQNSEQKVEHSQQFNDCYNETKLKNNTPNYAVEELCTKAYDTDSSRDSLMHGESENIILKEKLTVSWEDCIPHNNNTFTSIERPESVYTVGSTDTGFQEDGEIELETGMATSMDSTDSTKRFSSASRDSCIVPDEVDVYKIAESNSTSGYSTGLSDSCCNDRPEDDLSSKPLTEEELQDSVGPCDSEDGFSFQDNSLSKDSEMMNAEISDVTGETVTAFCNDSTSEALCETMVEDTTLTEIHDLLMSPEETKSSNLSEHTDNCDMPMEQSEELTKESGSKKSNENTSNVSTDSPALSTPEKKVSKNRPKFETQKKQPITVTKAQRTSRVCDSEIDKNRQIAKSPKKNVMSKIKAMIEATSCKNANKSKPEAPEPVPKRAVSAPKRSRWEAVTSKIAASLAEEKTKPKTKREIRSRVDTNLTSARLQVTTCKSPKLDSSRNSNCGDGTMTPLSMSSRDRRPLSEKNSAINLGKEVRAAMTREAKQDIKNPRPGKACSSSRPTSPVAASESSTTSVSVNSHNSRSKIAHWKGSTSTIASSIPPPAPPVTVKRLTTTAPSKTTAPMRTVNTRAVAKKPLAEQTGVRGAPHSSKPVRPPMWLSKAELTQEIQRLGTLCEARTKELNRLKMETKHVSVGFDAFAALFKYMVEDLNALSVPTLSEDLEKTLKQLELAKQDLAYYEREVEEMKAHHSQELNDLSNKLFEVYQGEITELSAKHQEELNQLNYDHQQQIQKLTITLQASADEEQSKSDSLISQLQQELITQREELQLFQDREIKDLEEKHTRATNTLQEHIEQLQKKCTELNQHSMSMEDAMRKDTDTKLQWVSARKVDLEKEVESLKAVLEMKNKELHSLRVQTLEMEKQLEELPLAREKIKMLQARAEDLEALMVEKTKLERKLSTENQIIKDTYEKESKVNKRLSMENEELQWRLRQAETSLLSGSFSEVSEYPEDVENGTTSPVKTPPAPHLSRSVFFTFIDKDDNFSSSPRSQYKKITPGFSSNYKTSPGKTLKSPSAPSPRRAKSHSEPPQPPVLSNTPRKMLKQKTTPKRQRSGSDCGRPTIEHAEITFSSVTGSMASSISSESSVFEHKEQLLEEHEEQIMETLQILHEQRSMESPSDEPVTPSEKEWSNGDAKILQISPDFEVGDMSRSSEFSDPKTYYHMTFPVPKETGIVDCDTEDTGKNASKKANPSKVSINVIHSTTANNDSNDLKDLPKVSLNDPLEDCSSATESNKAESTLNDSVKSAVSVDTIQNGESIKNSEAQDQWRTI